jgi:hypothetical protein
MKQLQAKSYESTLTIAPHEPGLMVSMQAHWQLEQVKIILSDKEVQRLIEFLSDYLKSKTTTP